MDNDPNIINAADYFRGKSFILVDDVRVAEWSPGSTSLNTLPPTQVHLLVEMKDLGTIVIRLKSRRAADELLDALKFHADNVWHPES